MKHQVRATRHAASPDLPARRVNQGQQLDRPITPILMGQLARAPFLPTEACHRRGFERPSLIFGPDREAEFRPLEISPLDQLFFGSASGSTTVTTSPFLRLRFELPV